MLDAILSEIEFAGSANREQPSHEVCVFLSLLPNYPYYSANVMNRRTLSGPVGVLGVSKNPSNSHFDQTSCFQVLFSLSIEMRGSCAYSLQLKLELLVRKRTPLI